MEGIRDLSDWKDGSLPPRHSPSARYWFKFDLDGIPLPILPCAVAQIWPNLRGPGAAYLFSKEIPTTLLADFFERGYSSSDLIPPGSESSHYTPTGVKIAIIPSNITPLDESGRPRTEYLHETTKWSKLSELINIKEEHFAALWKALNAYPRLGHTLTLGALRCFEFLGRTADNQGVSGHLATPRLRFIWSVRQHKESACFDTRCILIARKATWFEPKDWSFLENESPTSHVGVASAMRHLRAFKQDSHSPLYLPFAISVYVLEECRTKIVRIYAPVVACADRENRGYVKQAERSKIDAERLYMLELVQKNMPESFGTVQMDLNNIESLWNCLVIVAKELPDTAKSEDVCRSNESILAALYCLRQELNGLREALQFCEMTINTFLSTRPHYLNQLDADRNSKIAQAALQDSSAMKTIAVLTMAFLPATFLAALFAMPSLNWDQPKHFVIYWKIAIPLTAATFVLWLAVTQWRPVLRSHYIKYQKERAEKKRQRKYAKEKEQWTLERKKKAAELRRVEEDQKGKAIEAHSAV